MTAQQFLDSTARRIEDFYRSDFSRYEKSIGDNGDVRFDSRVVDAAFYALSAGGKRLRPSLVIAAADAVAAASSDAVDLGSDDLTAVAAAFEYIHTYSLIHDDLPVMDNDRMRRGRPSCHVAYDTPTAVLAGLLLVAKAFRAVAGTALPARREIGGVLEEASGINGMVGGQALDILSEGRDPDIGELIRIHTGKTAALIRGSMLAGALAAGAAPETSRQIADAGGAAGLAFQIIDDLLDVQSSAEVMGKPVGVDSGKGKRTYPIVIGIEASRERASALITEAEGHLRKAADEDTILFSLIRFIMMRES